MSEKPTSQGRPQTFQLSDLRTAYERHDSRANYTKYFHFYSVPTISRTLCSLFPLKKLSWNHMAGQPSTAPTMQRVVATNCQSITQLVPSPNQGNTNFTNSLV